MGTALREPRTYAPKHLAEKILTSRAALEGERKQVTVLFADVKGSMELAERLDPEDWHKIMDRFFQLLADGVHRFEGTVNQYTGDGVMALFGAPIAHEDHARRACYAALYLQDELGRHAEELKRTLAETRAGEEPAPEPEADPTSLDERRRRVHERAQEAIDAMREPPPE